MTMSMIIRLKRVNNHVFEKSKEKELQQKVPTMLKRKEYC